MTQIKTDKEVVMERRLETLERALDQVIRNRKNANELAERWELTANYYFNRYHATRVELVRRRLDLIDASKMIDALLNEGKPEMPDIDITDDLDV